MYAYVDNDPLNLVDPSGHAAATVASAARSVSNSKYVQGSFGGFAQIPGDVEAYATDLRSDPLEFLRKSGPTLAGIGMPAASSVTRIPVVGRSIGQSRSQLAIQKQAGHIRGTPQNINRIKQGKPTSTFFGKRSGDELTQRAFKDGKVVAGRPNVKEYDFGFSVGTGPKGGMQSRVRVHQGSNGKIHGHPSGPESF